MNHSIVDSIRSKSLASVALLVTGSAWAQHCYVIHDEFAHRIAVRGVVQDVQWTDARVTLSIECTGAEGRHVHKLENTSPAVLRRALGSNKHAIEVGKEIAVEYVPSNRDASTGILTRVVMQDGRVAIHALPLRPAPVAS